MKKSFFLCLVLIIVLGYACQRAHPPSDVKKGLSKAMLNFLWHDKRNDTSKIRFEIMDVTFFEERNFYECEYKVRLHVIATGYDTIGTMTANVSKDFARVKRKL